MNNGQTPYTVTTSTMQNGSRPNVETRPASNRPAALATVYDLQLPLIRQGWTEQRFTCQVGRYRWTYQHPERPGRVVIVAEPTRN